MTIIPHRLEETDPRIQAALAELRSLILHRFPAATFEVTLGEDPVGVYLKATVDVADTDEVVPTFLERMIEMQIEEELPIYVIPLQPIGRVLAQLRQKAERSVESRRLLP